MAKEWVVHCKAVGNGETALKYLTPYIYRVALSNRRLVSLEDGDVTFRYKPHNTPWTTMTLDAIAFLHRFLQHILPKGVHKIRYSGFLHPNAGHTLVAQEQLAASDTASDRLPEALAATFGIDLMDASLTDASPANVPSATRQSRTVLDAVPIVVGHCGISAHCPRHIGRHAHHHETDSKSTACADLSSVSGSKNTHFSVNRLRVLEARSPAHIPSHTSYFPEDHQPGSGDTATTSGSFPSTRVSSSALFFSSWWRKIQNRSLIRVFPLTIPVPVRCQCMVVLHSSHKRNGTRAERRI